VLSFVVIEVFAEDGYRLWLRYDAIQNSEILKEYQSSIQSLYLEKPTATLTVAKTELLMATKGLLGISLGLSTNVNSHGTLILGTPTTSKLIASLKLDEQLGTVGPEGYVIISAEVKGKKCTIIAAHNDIGVLYGTFNFIRLLQMQEHITSLAIQSTPRIKYRILNHWDNLDRTVERGYAGFSLWDWHKLPDYIDPRYYDYARANASAGINGTVVTNVNANAQALTPHYLEKFAALAAVFRPYGIRIYLTARFSAPVDIGKLKTADPLNDEVKLWWKNKIDEIYKYIPDFGGFVVKANSEGQPGPQNYDRTHADGANMLAQVLAPYRGIVMWRAFVYDNKVPDDRAKQAYNEFKPLDGKFLPNVLVQVKNGPIDFQPREPFHPLFGAMPATPLMMEFQLTQEYLGYATHLVYLAPLFKECLDSDTYSKGKGSFVSKVIDGSLEDHKISGMAGVANIGNDRNWCGHPFAQANWYAFARLAWEPDLDADAIAGEWIKMTYSNQKEVVQTLTRIMMQSREITVNYMTPLGLHHIMGWDHHYGPAHGSKTSRVPTGHQYTTIKPIAWPSGLKGHQREVTRWVNTLPKCKGSMKHWRLARKSTCFGFHHVRWDHKMKSGKTLWEDLCARYYKGAEDVRKMQNAWNSLQGKIDDDRFKQVRSLLAIQYKEAIWWRNACLLYFQTFARKEIPVDFERPDKTLEYYQSLEFPFAPGIRPRW
jgi:alpha-glucuronidase